MLFLRYGKITEKGRCNQQLPYRERKSVGSLPSCGQTFRSHKIPCVFFGVSSDVLLAIDMKKAGKRSTTIWWKQTPLAMGERGRSARRFCARQPKKSPASYKKTASALICTSKAFNVWGVYHFFSAFSVRDAISNCKFQKETIAFWWKKCYNHLAKQTEYFCK